MAADDLTALGLELRAQAAAWMDGLLGEWTLPGAEAAAEPLFELGLLETAVRSLADEIAALTRVQAALTSGFPGSPAATLPVDGSAAEAEEEDVRTVRGSSAGADGPAPHSPSGPPSGGVGASPHLAPAADRAIAGRAWSRDAGASASSEARSWDAPPAPASRSALTPPAAGGQARRLDLPFSADSAHRDAFEAGESAAERTSPRTTATLDVPPSASVGIRGLGDLAMLAGAHGLDLPPEAEPTSAEPTSPEPTSAYETGIDRDAAARPRRGDGAPVPNPASLRETPRPVPASSSDAVPFAPSASPPIRLRAWDRPPAGDQPEASGAEVDGGTAEDDRKPRRWPGLPMSDASVVRDGGIAPGGTTPGPIALPFLHMPGEPVNEGSASESGAAPFPAPAGRAVPPWPATPGGARDSGPASPGLFGGAANEAGDARDAAALPRTPGRLRPAAEILAGLRVAAPTAAAARETGTRAAAFEVEEALRRAAGADGGQVREGTTRAAVIGAVPAAEPAARRAPEAGAAPD
ncbi:MAG TPA: hypothetical protein VGB15_22840, partial [Longimicrobium sp.]